MTSPRPRPAIFSEFKSRFYEYVCYSRGSTYLFPPKVLETRRRQLSVSHGVLNIFVPEVRLQRPRIVASVGERIAAGMPSM